MSARKPGHRQPKPTDTAVRAEVERLSREQASLTPPPAVEGYAQTVLRNDAEAYEDELTPATGEAQ